MLLGDDVTFQQVATAFKEYVNTHDVTGMSTVDILKKIIFGTEETLDGTGKEGKRETRNQGHRN